MNHREEYLLPFITNIDILCIANAFVVVNDNRKRHFGPFMKNDLLSYHA